MAKKPSKPQKPWGNSKYEDWMPARIIALMSDGYSKAEVAAELDISRETLYQWCKKDGPYYIPDFAEAIERGVYLGQAWWERQARAGIWGGKRFNATAYIYTMRCRFPKEYGQNGSQGDDEPPGFVVKKAPEA